jgi:hypothetical protein
MRYLSGTIMAEYLPASKHGYAFGSTHCRKHNNMVHSMPFPSNSNLSIHRKRDYRQASVQWYLEYGYTLLDAIDLICSSSVESETNFQWMFEPSSRSNFTSQGGKDRTVRPTSMAR